ncbi:MAG: WG repeat-containing protein [Kordia sp.]|uniref:WG repeat-containing protein n=1 Tax=Kordia sp. TaxID=1965332 RepID=UPI00385D8F9A
MKNKITIILLLISINWTFSQEKIKADIDIINFLGRVPQKTESNSLSDNLLRILYYKIQPKEYPKIGYLNNKGQIVIKPKFNMASEFYGDYANVIKDSLYGYVNKDGKETYLENYTDVFFYYGNTGIVKKNGKYGLINRKGDSLTEFKYTMVSNFGFNHFKCQTENKKSHILDSNGNVIFNRSLKFDIQSHYFDKDSIIVFRETIDRKKLNGLVSIDEKVIIQPKFENIYFINDSELYVVKNNKKFGFIDKSGKVVIPLIYDKVGFNINDNLIPALKDGKWGFINRENETKIPFEYDDATAFLNGLAFVKKGENYGCINTKNKIKVKFDLKKTKYPFFTNDLALFEENGKYGFINKKGRIKIPAIYDKALPFVNELAYVEVDGKVGYINKKGEEIIPIKYKQLWFESDGIIRFAE